MQLRNFRIIALFAHSFSFLLFRKSYFENLTSKIRVKKQFLNIIPSTIVCDRCATFARNKTTCVAFTLINKIKKRDCEFRSWCTRTSTGSETSVAQGVSTFASAIFIDTISSCTINTLFSTRFCFSYCRYSYLNILSFKKLQSLAFFIRLFDKIFLGECLIFCEKKNRILWINFLYSEPLTELKNNSLPIKIFSYKSL